MHPSPQARLQGHLLQNPHRKAQGFPDLYVLDGTIHPKLPQEKASFVRRILIWQQDISAQGVKAFHDLEMQQVIPNVEMEELNGLGLEELKPGDFLFSRDIHGSGHLEDDVLIAFVTDQDFLSQDTQSLLAKARTNMLGPYHDMQPGPPYIDDEKELVGGTAIERDPVFLAPTGIHAPNAQVKEAAVKFGGVPISREGHFAILKELVQAIATSTVEITHYGDPAYIRQAELASSLMNTPRIGHNDNVAIRSSILQCLTNVNVALKLADVMSSTFGGPHFDMRDTLGQLTVMMALSHFSELYKKRHNPGRFHILGLGLYIRLHEFVGASFSGFFRHGGTGPTAPPGMKPDPSDIRATIISYPNAKMSDGAASLAFASLPQKGIFTIAPEMRCFQNSLPPRSSGSHATFVEHGHLIMSRQSQLDFYTRSLLQMMTYFTAQFPDDLEVAMNPQKILEAFSMKAENGNLIRPSAWPHMPGHCLDNNGTRVSQDAARSQAMAEVLDHRIDILQSRGLRLTKLQAPESSLASKELARKLTQRYVDSSVIPLPAATEKVQSKKGLGKTLQATDPDEEPTSRPAKRSRGKANINPERMEVNSEDLTEHQPLGVQRETRGSARQQLLEKQANIADSGATEDSVLQRHEMAAPLPAMSGIEEGASSSRITKFLDTAFSLEGLQAVLVERQKVFQSVATASKPGDYTTHIQYTREATRGIVHHPFSAKTASTLLGFWNQYNSLSKDQDYYQLAVYQRTKDLFILNYMAHTWLYRDVQQRAEKSYMTSTYDQTCYVDRLTQDVDDQVNKRSPCVTLKAEDYFPDLRVTPFRKAWGNKHVPNPKRRTREQLWNSLWPVIASAFTEWLHFPTHENARPTAWVTGHFLRYCPPAVLYLPAVQHAHSNIRSQLISSLAPSRTLEFKDLLPFAKALSESPAALCDTEEYRLICELGQLHNLPPPSSPSLPEEENDETDDEDYVDLEHEESDVNQDDPDYVDDDFASASPMPSLGKGPSKKRQARIRNLGHESIPYQPATPPHLQLAGMQSMVAYLRHIHAAYPTFDQTPSPSRLISLLADKDENLNHFLPFRELAPDRKRWRSHPESPYSPELAKTNQGLFGALLHRGVTYNTPLSRDGDKLIYGVDEWEELIAKHVNPDVDANGNILRRNDSYFVNMRAYGPANSSRSPSLVRLYFDKVESLDWGMELKQNLHSFSDCYDFFMPPRKPPRFFNIGSLTSFLISADFVYAEVFPMPSPQEIGQYVWQLNKGAVRCLRLLGLLETPAGSHGRLPPPDRDACIEAFVTLYNFLDNELTVTEKAEMHFDVFMVEHAACKLTRAVPRYYEIA
ncbi:hypothetical protein EYR38_008448 [Pleurotus pulmonarius]|nr:hypothetical protein EYR38_008448 [Pleurotus pulmonarius]